MAAMLVFSFRGRYRYLRCREKSALPAGFRGPDEKTLLHTLTLLGAFIVELKSSKISLLHQ